MTDQDPIRSAADDLYATLSEHTEDVLDEACSATWPGGEDEWWSQDGPAADLEAHREATFRRVMAEHAAICLERSLGRYNGSPVEAS